MLTVSLTDSLSANATSAAPGMFGWIQTERGQTGVEVNFLVYALAERCVR